jgi:hypothetical protein
MCGWELVAIADNLKRNLELAMVSHYLKFKDDRTSVYVEHVYNFDLSQGVSEDVAATMALFSAGGISQSMNMFELSQKGWKNKFHTMKQKICRFF